MKHLVIGLFIFSSGMLFSQSGRKKNIQWMQCKMKRGTKSQVKYFTVHKRYDLIIPYKSLYGHIMMDHMGRAGEKGKGFRITIFVRDSKIGGLVQGKSSPVLKGPWWRHEVTVEDAKHKTKVWCRMK